MQQVQIRLLTPQKFENRFKYTLNFINNHPISLANRMKLISGPTNSNAIQISYIRNINHSDSSLVIHRAYNLFEENINVSEFSLKTTSFNNKQYYYAHVESSFSDLTIREKIVPFDIFESIFFFISRYEEIYGESQFIDRSGWLNEDQHLLIKNNASYIPVVDQLILLLLEIVGLRISHLPTQYGLSHDVDILYRFKNPIYLLRSLGSSIYKLRGLSQIGRDIKHYGQMIIGSRKDPYDTFNFMFDKSNTWKSKVVYLMAGGNTPFDNKYSLKDTKVREIISIATKRGYLIGLHPSFNAAFDINLFKEEKRLIESILEYSVVHSRQHWLRFDWRITPRIFEELNILNDSSIGYNHHIGFRCGTGYPYFLYDFINETPYLWKEEPLIIMDSASIHQATSEQSNAISLIQSFIEANKYNTQILFNFHNSRFDETTKIGKNLRCFYIENLPSCLST